MWPSLAWWGWLWFDDGTQKSPRPLTVAGFGGRVPRSFALSNIFKKHVSSFDQVGWQLLNAFNL